MQIFFKFRCNWSKYFSTLCRIISNDKCIQIKYFRHMSYLWKHWLKVHVIDIKRLVIFPTANLRVLVIHDLNIGSSSFYSLIIDHYMLLPDVWEACSCTRRQQLTQTLFGGSESVLQAVNYEVRLIWSDVKLSLQHTYP